MTRIQLCPSLYQLLKLMVRYPELYGLVVKMTVTFYLAQLYCRCSLFILYLGSIRGNNVGCSVPGSVGSTVT